ncbi:hypothetical protein LZ605_22760 (plasmid) [Stenotrophomonas maltophilia]|jgi:hypothetical protein|nr:hypothetical protein LZ605_00210 [Stenotrophomonas maltophilia]UQY98109.1 hypothetical protein LZ605_22700 [Stenotrophomonas maltophilia]UQY98192.1 hypothetical protein LZ605_22760 [Stenotrophomonas maltophilia]
MPALVGASMGAGGTLAEPGQAGYTKRGNGMSFPVTAFFVAEASEVPAGRFYRNNGQWFMSVDANQGQGGGLSAICLTGDQTGVFSPRENGTVTYVGGEFQVEIRVAGIDATVDRQEGYWNASIIIGEEFAIYAQRGNGDAVISLDGKMSRGNGLSGCRRRFTAWSAWLIRPDGRQIGEEPLFSVVSIPKVD